MSINKFAILGERCSGTNYLEEIIKENFELTYTSEYGNKHFFCFRNYAHFVNTDKTLFIGIVRNPIYWLNSFSKELHHVPEINRKNLHNFLFNEFYSVCDVPNDTNSTNSFLMKTVPSISSSCLNKEDLNYKTGKKYKNIFDLREAKNDYLIRIMPTKVKNYILLNYEDILYNFETVMQTIKTKFQLKQLNPTFINVKKYKKSEKYNFVQQRAIAFNRQLQNTIWINLNLLQEEHLGYFKTQDGNQFNNKKGQASIK
jgi:hypothetical protein